VLSPADDRFEAALPGYTGWLARVGGASRAESVLGGLGELRRRGASDEDWVLVHDAARCLLRPQWVDALIDACQHDAVGGLLAQPVADTLKAGDAASRVTATVDRRDKWAAQTPQMFRLDLVERALTAMGAAATDEASAVEALGLAPRLVRASMANFKVTWPEDFELAARLLARA
jgi:2-C-methyl-D-erythritol 4-phosphate cytidylyltransferase